MRRGAFIVAHREYMANVRTKAFWIGILLIPVLLTVMAVVPTWLGKTKDARRFAVIDGSGWLLAAVEERAAVEDTLRLLGALRSKPADDPSMAGLRRTLGDASAALSALDGAKLADAARALTVAGKSRLSDEAAVQLDPTLHAALGERRPAFLEWLNGLAPRDAKAIDSNLSRASHVRVEVPPGGDPEAELRRWLADGPRQLFAFFVIGPDPLADAVGEQNKYVSNNLTDEDLKQWFSRHATREVESRRFAREGITPDVARRIQAPVRFAEKQVGAGGEEKEVAKTDVLRQWAPIAFTYLLWISIYSIAAALMTNTIEEKSSRIIEVLLSSVSPVELLGGKVLGMAAVGLTMVGAWVGFFLAALQFLPQLLGATGFPDLTQLVSDPVYLVSFLVYFLLGYLLYAAILVGIGAVCTSLQEAQNLMGPVMMLLFVPFVTMIPIGKDPNGLLARVVSYIPIYTPFTMMNRAAGPPPWWEYILTTVLLVVSVIGALWMAAKVFRIGILMTGKPPKLREIWHWIKTKEQ